MALTAKKLDAVRPTVPVAEAGRQDLVRVNFNVRESVRRTWKRSALERQMTVAQLVEAAVNEYLSK
jgi:hypothetical protein